MFSPVFGGRILSSSDDDSITALHWRLFLVPAAAFLDPSAPSVDAAFLFLSSPSWEECASSSSGKASGAASRRIPFLAFFSAFFSGTL